MTLTPGPGIGRISRLAEMGRGDAGPGAVVQSESAGLFRQSHREVGMVVRLFSRLAGVVALTALIGPFSGSCGGGGSPSGGSTPPVTVTPTPSPSAPTGGGGNPNAASCPLGPGDHRSECEKTSPKLQDAVLTALERVVQQNPQFFDKTEEAGIGTGQ